MLGVAQLKGEGYIPLTRGQGHEGIWARMVEGQLQLLLGWRQDEFIIDTHELPVLERRLRELIHGS